MRTTPRIVTRGKENGEENSAVVPQRFFFFFFFYEDALGMGVTCIPDPLGHPAPAVKGPGVTWLLGLINPWFKRGRRSPWCQGDLNPGTLPLDLKHLHTRFAPGQLGEASLVSGDFVFSFYK